MQVGRGYVLTSALRKFPNLKKGKVVGIRSGGEFSLECAGHSVETLLAQGIAQS